MIGEKKEKRKEKSRRDFPAVGLMDSARSVEVTGRMRKGAEIPKKQ